MPGPYEPGENERGAAAPFVRGGWLGEEAAAPYAPPTNAAPPPQYAPPTYAPPPPQYAPPTYAAPPPYPQAPSGYPPPGQMPYQPRRPQPKSNAGVIALTSIGAVLVIVVSLFIFAATRSAQATHPPRPLESGDEQRLASSASPSVVNIRGTCGNYRISGSGFAVASDLVITNAHVVAGMSSPTVFSSAGREYRSTPVAYDPDRDLAVLKVDGGDFISMTLVRSDPPEGEGVVALGYPLAGPYASTAGSVRVVADEERESIYGGKATRQKTIFLNLDLEPGNSGGPVVNTDGEVVGVAVATSLVWKSSGLAIPYGEVAKKIDQVKSKGGTTASTGSCLTH